MASNLTEEAKENFAKENEDFCTIEASVVTGFEECARGEAKEKFGVDVKASRGKIIWRVPLDRLPEVLSMGSIDNCRVLMHTVPHFNFTDQNDSLGRLQKMILNINWESGLKAWRRLFEFPHPIASQPDVIPSPEELVDVVLIQRLPQSKDKSDKKKKKQGKGKGKKGDKDKKAQHEKDADGRKVNDSKDERSIIGENLDRGDGNTGGLSGAESKAEHVEEPTGTLKSDCPGGDGDVGAKLKQEGDETACDEPKKIRVVASPKTVVIKKVPASEIERNINIKVLGPAPEENAFPTALKSEELRQLEPMEVDSPFRAKSFPLSKTGEGKCKTTTTELSNLAEMAGEGKNTSNSESADAAFACSVIKRLSTPPASPSKTLQDGGACATPPSTPIVGPESPFLSGNHRGPSEPALIMTEDLGSSVDPVSFHKMALSPAVASSLNLSQSESVPVVSDASTPLPGVDNSGKDEVQSTESPQKGDYTGGLVTEKKLDAKSSEEMKGEQSATEKSSEGNQQAKEAAAVKAPQEKERDPTKPRFRVTCNRVGEHPFDSSSAAASFGSAVITYFKWPVDLKNFDIEVLLNIDNEEVSVSLALTKTSLHNRNLVAFGPTTLRATICYNMLRLCRIRNGDFICDPMCGTSAIPVESALNWTNCFTFGGDFHEKALERTVLNMDAVQQKHWAQRKSHLKLDAVQWNIEHFPLRDACVDVFVSDLPFGHRLGSRTVNRTLYPNLLSEMARTARTGARACLLTEDRTSLIKAIQTYCKYWQRRLVLSVNIGGLSGFVFVLIRTAANLRGEVKLVVSPAGSVCSERGVPSTSIVPTSNAATQASSVSLESCTHPTSSQASSVGENSQEKDIGLPMISAATENCSTQESSVSAAKDAVGSGIGQTSSQPPEGVQEILQ